MQKSRRQCQSQTSLTNVALGYNYEEKKKGKEKKSINQTVTNMLCIIPNNMRRSDSKLTRALGTDIEVTVDPNLIRP